jgi:hypothetical protein
MVIPKGFDIKLENKNKWIANEHLGVAIEK